MPALAIDYQSGFNDAFRDAITLLPKIGYFLLILIVGVILAKFVQKILTKVLQKVGFDSLVERGGVKKALSKSKYDAAQILARIVYYFIFLLVLSAAFGVFGSDNPVSMFLAEIIGFLPNLFVAVLVIVIAAAVAAAVKELVSNTLSGLGYGSALANAASLFILAFGVFAALDQLGIAPLIVTGIFYAILALVIVPLIIAFGVGGIEPAREAIRSAQDKGQEKAQEMRQEFTSDEDDAGEEEEDYSDEYDEYEEEEEPAAPAPTRAVRRSRSSTTPTPNPVRRRRTTV
ncbi:MAG: mechanosensitive ion channel family protein [Mycobacteriales bacterium]